MWKERRESRVSQEGQETDAAADADGRLLLKSLPVVLQLTTWTLLVQLFPSRMVAGASCSSSVAEVHEEQEVEWDADLRIKTSRSLRFLSIPRSLAVAASSPAAMSSSRWPNGSQWTGRHEGRDTQASDTQTRVAASAAASAVGTLPSLPSILPPP